jgi:transketolase
MRNAFSASLVALAQRDERVALLTGDHGYSLFDALRSTCPDRYLNAGIAEQNMIGVAAGMAQAGLRPIVYGLSAFMPLRVLDQIKMNVCLPNLPVLLVGDGAGVVYSSLGTSHQCTEDIAALRALPNMTILSPADGFELASCMELAITMASPVYLRMGKADLGSVHTAPPAIVPGKLLPLRQGRGSLTWIATGSMTHTALRAAQMWPDSSVWSAPCVKPLDTPSVASICASSQAVIVLEEHSVHGGLGTAIAEIALEHAPTRVLRIGVEDRFSAACGSYESLMAEHGLTDDHVVRKVSEYLSGFATVSYQRVAGRKSPPPGVRIARGDLIAAGPNDAVRA